MGANNYFEGSETANHSWRLRARTLTDLAFPVPTFQPVANNKVLALDLHPTGTPTESAGNGFTWFDACDADVMHNNNAPVRCARLAIRSEGAVVGAVPYNGAAQFNLFFETGNTLRWGVNYAGHFYPVADNAYQIGSGTSRVKDVYLSGNGPTQNPYAAHEHSLTKTILALQARITALESA